MVNFSVYLHDDIGISYGSRGGMYSGQPPYPGMYQPGASQGAGDTQETTYLYIPNNAVGAIIGTKGSHIRNIIRFSGASVKIAPLDQDKPQDTQTERKVTIVGSPEAQWKVNFCFYFYLYSTFNSIKYFTCGLLYGIKIFCWQRKNKKFKKI